jgi:hypothetical protein
MTNSSNEPYDSTKNLIYSEPVELSKIEINKILSSNDNRAICHALISMAFYEEDLDFCSTIIMKCFENKNEYVRGNAVLCIGHIARIHKIVYKELPSIVYRGLNDSSSYVRGHAESALSDIRVFMPDLAKQMKKMFGI